MGREVDSMKVIDVVEIIIGLILGLLIPKK